MYFRDQLRSRSSSGSYQHLRRPSWIFREVHVRNCDVDFYADGSAGYLLDLNQHSQPSRRHLFIAEVHHVPEKSGALLAGRNRICATLSARLRHVANDFAEEVDCKIIRAMLGSIAPPPPAFIEGYAVIIVPPTSSPTGTTFTNELDVTGIYTDLKGALVV